MSVKFHVQQVRISMQQGGYLGEQRAKLIAAFIELNLLREWCAPEARAARPGDGAVPRPPLRVIFIVSARP